MRFRPGDLVLVQALGKGTVRDVRRGRYSVEIKGRVLEVDERLLSPADHVRARKPAEISASPTDALPQRAYAAVSLDLHGMTTAEAEQALDGFLNDALLAGHPEVRVIHGRSGGRLKSAVHARLAALPSVRSWRLDPRNPGATIVTL